MARPGLRKNYPTPNASAYAHANPNARFLRGTAKPTNTKRKAIKSMLTEKEPTYGGGGARPQYGGARLTRPSFQQLTVANQRSFSQQRRPSFRQLNRRYERFLRKPRRTIPRGITGTK